MNIKRQFLKPEYYLNPRQIIKRLFSRNVKKVDLLWGHKDFSIDQTETIGISLKSFGLYDLALTETLLRLVNKSSLCVDVGANIGYFTSLMAAYSQKVYSFEAHPRIYEKLKSNCGHYNNVDLMSFAISSQNGVADLSIPDDFNKNQGIATLESIDSGDKTEVPARTLDDLFPDTNIDILKVDVEGHELEVFKGAKNILNKKRIQNILFEEHQGAQSKSIKFLLEHDYQVFRITKGFFDLQVVDLKNADNLPDWEPANYIATFNVKNIFNSKKYKTFQL